MGYCESILGQHRKMLPMRRGNIVCPLRSLGMKTTRLLSLTITALVALSQPIWAQGGFRGGGTGHVSGGGFGGGHFGGARSGSVGGGGFHAVPHSFGGAPFTGRSFSGSGATLRYYSGAGRTPAARTSAPNARVNRSISSSTGRSASISRPQNRAGSLAPHNLRTSNQRMSTAAAQRAIANHKAFARHDGNWHRDWDRHRAHFDRGHVFVFVNGFWWGFYPWDYYPYGYGYGYYPYDYDGYPYDGYDYSSSDPYSYYNGYAPFGQ